MALYSGVLKSGSFLLKVCVFYQDGYLGNHPIIASNHRCGSAPELVLKAAVRQQQQIAKEKINNAVEVQGKNMAGCVCKHNVVSVCLFVFLVMDSDLKEDIWYKCEQDRKGNKGESQPLKRVMNLINFQYNV